MIVEIDIEKLRNEKKDLEAQMQRVDRLLELAESYGKPVVKTVEATAITTVVATPAPPPATDNGKKKRRGFTAGFRRAVTLALYTGPATESELTKALGWEPARTRVVVGPMLKYKLCYLNEHGRLELSSDGKQQAAWFLAHPGYLTYCPKQAVR